MPTKVPDLAALERDLDEFMATHTLSASTRASYEFAWRVWTDFCAPLGTDPLAPTIDTAKAFVAAAAAGTLRRRGVPEGAARAMQAASLDMLLAGVRHHLLAAGATVPWQQPQHVKAFQEERKGYLRKHARRPERANPLTEDDMRVLLTAQPQPSLAELARRAFDLTALDTGMSTPVMCRLRHSDFREVYDATGALMRVEVTVAPSPQREPSSAAAPGVVHLLCDHDERVPYLPHPCAACAVHELLEILDALPPDSLLFRQAAVPGVDDQGFSQGMRVRLHRLRRLWRTLEPNDSPAEGTRAALAVRADLGATAQRSEVDWLVAATRYALAVTASDQAAMILRARAILAMSWVIGLRSGSDPAECRRRDVVSTPKGLAVTIPKAKNDQNGEGWAGGLTLGESPELCPVRHMTAWLAVRDAAAGGAKGEFADQPLFCHGRKGRLQPSESIVNFFQASNAGLRLLQEIAGLEDFTPHSTRTGYAQTAIEQGRSMYEVKATMRHAKPETTLKYAKPAAADRSAKRLAARLVEDHTSGGAADQSSDSHPGER